MTVRGAAAAALLVGALPAWQFAPAAPATDQQEGDDFVAAVELAGLGGRWEGTTAGATAEPGEPVHAGQGAGTTVWLRWQAPADGTVTFTATDADGPTVTAAYEGKSVDALTALADSVRSDAGGSPLRFPVTQWTTYHVAVDSLGGAQPGPAGPVTVDYALFTPEGDDFAAARTLTGASGAVSTTTFAASRQPGEPAHGSGPVGGVGGSVWLRWIAPETGTWVVSSWGEVGPPTLAAYRGHQLDDLVELAAGIGDQLELHVTAGRTYRIAVAPGHRDGTGAPVEGDVAMSYHLVAPANDDLTTATTLTGSQGRARLTLTGTAEPGEPAHAGSPASASRWYRWRPAGDGLAEVRIDGPARLAAYVPGSSRGVRVDDLRRLAAASSGDGSPVRLTFPVPRFSTVLIAVDRTDTPTGAATGPRFLRYRLGPPLNDRPQDATRLVTPGSRQGTTFGATGTAEPTLPGGRRAVWYRLRPGQSGPLVAQTAGSGFDTVLAVYKDTGSRLRLVTADDNGGPGVTSLARFVRRPQQDYLVAVGGRPGHRGQVLLSVAPPHRPVASVSDIWVEEGHTARFVVRLSPSSDRSHRLTVRTRHGSATGADYHPLAESVVFSPGQNKRQVVVVPTVDDGTDEPREDFRLGLTAGSGVLVAGGTARAFVADDDAAPALGIETAPGPESAVSIDFELRLSEPSERPVTTRLATADDGTPLPVAPAVASEDYDTRSAQLVIPAGLVETQLAVTAEDDAFDEPDETFFVVSDRPVNARVQESVVPGLLLDDDPTPQLTVHDIEEVEGESGVVRLLDIPVTLNAPTQNPVSFFYTTVGGTAVGPYDFRRTSGVLHIAPGESGTVANVLLRPDNLVEGDEYFFIDISASVGATIADERGQVLIIDDD